MKFLKSAVLAATAAAPALVSAADFETDVARRGRRLVAFGDSCTATADCDAGLVCDGAACVHCTVDADCLVPNPICDAEGYCGQCSSADATGDGECVADTNIAPTHNTCIDTDSNQCIDDDCIYTGSGGGVNQCIPTDVDAKAWGIEFDLNQFAVASGVSPNTIDVTFDTWLGPGASGAATTGAVEVTVYKDDCETPPTPDGVIVSSPVETLTGTLGTDTGTTHGYHVHDSTVVLDTTRLTWADIWTGTLSFNSKWPNNPKFASGSTSKGQVDICIKVDVYADAAKTIHVSFRTVTLGLYIDLENNDYQISSTAVGLQTEDAGTIDISDQFDCTVCFCDHDAVPVPTECPDPTMTSLPPLVQNSYVELCVYAENVNSYVSQFSMDMDQCKGEMADPSSAGCTTGKEHKDIVDLAPAYNNMLPGLVTITPPAPVVGTTEPRLVMVKSQLLGDFYKNDADPGTAGLQLAEIYITGVCNLAFKTTVRRLGSSPSSSSALQARRRTVEFISEIPYQTTVTPIPGEENTDFLADDHDQEPHEGGDHDKKKKDASDAIVEAAANGEEEEDSAGVVAASVAGGLFVPVLAALAL